jgi:hypothetical protein
MALIPNRCKKEADFDADLENVEKVVKKLYL